MWIGEFEIIYPKLQNQYIFPPPFLLILFSVCFVCSALCRSMLLLDSARRARRHASPAVPCKYGFAFNIIFARLMPPHRYNSIACACNGHWSSFESRFLQPFDIFSKKNKTRAFYIRFPHTHTHVKHTFSSLQIGGCRSVAAAPRRASTKKIPRSPIFICWIVICLNEFIVFPLIDLAAKSIRNATCWSEFRFLWKELCYPSDGTEPHRANTHKMHKV